MFAKKKGLSRKAGAPVHDDLVKRHFKADAPDVVWLTDITEHWTDEGKLYMCAFKDVCSGRIVGYALGARMTSQLAVRALDNAVIGRNYQGTIVHSDRGSQGRVNWSKQHRLVEGIVDARQGLLRGSSNRGPFAVAS